MAATQEPDEEGLEWELKDWDNDLEQRRLCSITLVKKAPGNVTVWWPRVLTTDDAIDTTKIEGSAPLQFRDDTKIWLQVVNLKLMGSGCGRKHIGCLRRRLANTHLKTLRFRGPLTTYKDTPL